MLPGNIKYSFNHTEMQWLSALLAAHCETKPTRSEQLSAKLMLAALIQFSVRVNKQLVMQQKKYNLAISPAEAFVLAMYFSIDYSYINYPQLLINKLLNTIQEQYNHTS